MGFVQTLPDGSAEYTANGQSIVVQPDGAILVKPGDWLSKYSVAIFGDYNRMEKRFGKLYNGQVKPFGEIPGANINLIQVGETVYLMNRYNTRNGPQTPTSPLSEAEAIRQVEELLKKDYGLHGSKAKKTAEFVVKYAKYTANATSIGLVPAEALFAAAVEVGALTSGGTAALVVGELLVGIGLTASVVGAMLAPVAAIIALAKARNINITNAGLRGVAYGIVGWSFGHTMPKLPQKMKQNIENSTQLDAARELRLSTQAWDKSVRSVYTTMDNEAWRQKIEKPLLQLAYQRAGNYDPKAMAAALMQKLADQTFSRQYDKDNFLLAPVSDYPHA